MIPMPLLRAQRKDAQTFASGYPVNRENVFTVFAAQYLADGRVSYLAIDGLGDTRVVDAENIVFTVGSAIETQHRVIPVTGPQRITT